MFVDVALAPNNNEVQIHQFVAGKWNQLDTLSEHGQRVTGIDWAPASNRIVTCGAVSLTELHYITLHQSFFVLKVQLLDRHESAAEKTAEIRWRVNAFAI